MKDYTNNVVYIGEEKLNTSQNLYICNAYQVNLSERRSVHFKFYLSFSESFNAEGLNLRLKEEDLIKEYIKLNKLEEGKTYHFIFKYSDYFEVDVKTL